MRNRNTIGIAILGCYQGINGEQTNSNCNTPDRLTEPTKTALNKLIAVKSREFNIDPLAQSEFHGEMLPNIIGHSDVGSTTCPGNLIYNNMPQTRQLAYNLLQDLGGYKPALPTSAEFVRQSTQNITIEETKTKIFRHYDTIRVEQESIRDSVIINKEIIKIAEKSKIDKFKESIFNKLIVILTFIVVIMALYMFRNTIK
jgi:hypothetical protein